MALKRTTCSDLTCVNPIVRTADPYMMKEICRCDLRLTKRTFHYESKNDIKNHSIALLHSVLKEALKDSIVLTDQHKRVEDNIRLSTGTDYEHHH